MAIVNVAVVTFWVLGVVLVLVSLTWMVTVIVTAAFGVPVIWPVVAESFSPLGSF